MRTYEIENQISSLKSDLHGYQSKRDDINSEMTSLENDLDQVEYLIEKTDEEIAELKQQLNNLSEENDQEYRNSEWYEQKESLFDFDEIGELIK